jgi:DNA-binding NarL/FixJ family response regulator
VVIVDDHVMIRQGLRTMLEIYTDVEVLGEASNGDEARWSKLNMGTQSNAGVGVRRFG